MTSAINTGRPARALAPGRAFSTTVAVGVSVAILAVTLWLAWEAFWTDIARHNPHRSLAETLIFIPMAGALLGLLAGLIFLSGALLFAGLAAAAAVRRLGQVPFWVVCILIPLCGLAIYMQAWWMGSHLFPTDPPDMGFEYYTAETAYPYPPLQVLGRASLILAAYLIPWLCGSWWMLRR